MKNSIYYQLALAIVFCSFGRFFVQTYAGLEGKRTDFGRQPQKRAIGTGKAGISSWGGLVDNRKFNDQIC